MNSKNVNKLPIQRVLAWIFGSALFLFGSLYVGLQVAQRAGQYWDETPLTIVVQTGPQREALQTAYLAQLMDLSAEHPPCTGAFDVKKAVKALMNSPIMKEAKVSFLRPGILYVDYALRQPIALLADYENTALDAEGRTFPLSPFFSPKNLPEIYLGLEGPLNWSMSVKGEALDLAYELFALFRSIEVTELFIIKRIDVSRIRGESLGKREIVILAEDVITCEGGRLIFPRYIRLSTKNYIEAIGNYLKLRAHLIEKDREMPIGFKKGQTLLYRPHKIIDLRLPKLALIDATN